MANREEMALIRSARAGQVHAQSALGTRYLFGSSKLPRSISTGLYWLDRAARQGDPDAWMLIGSHIPFETAAQAPDPSLLCVWYERAFAAGVVQAGLVLAKLVLIAGHGLHDEALRRKAWRGLQAAADAGIAEAQWLLAQQIERIETSASRSMQDKTTDQHDMPLHLEWARRAADNGVMQARRRMADHAWAGSDYAAFLHWSLPVAQAIAADSSGTGSAVHQLSEEDSTLLCRCAQMLFRNVDYDANILERLWELAAQAGNKNAQFGLGLWLAKMDEKGRYIPRIPRLINYRKAIHWLTSAGQQGVADAWYVLSRIYLKAEYAGRSLADAEACLTCAAERGHVDAQLELGKRIWRKRRSERSNDIRAVHWLQKASAQGCAEAQQLLGSIATTAIPAPWAQAIQHRLIPSDYPLLAARIELATIFGLSQPEALLIDLNEADCGHCLLVDIRDQYARNKRRLILIQTEEQRQALIHTKQIFEKESRGEGRAEGNYRQRLYRLNRALSPLLNQHRRSPGFA